MTNSPKNLTVLSVAAIAIEEEHDLAVMRAAWQAFRDSNEMCTPTDLPEWEQLKPNYVARWRAVINAVREKESAHQREKAAAILANVDAEMAARYDC